MTEPTGNAAAEASQSDGANLQDDSPESNGSPQHPKPRLGIRNIALIIFLVAIVLFGLLVPMPFHGPTADPLADLAHAPLFCALALGALGVLAIVVPGVRSAHRVNWVSVVFRSALVFVFLAGFGIAVEYLQRSVGRNASWGDVRANMIGSLAGILLFWSMESRRRGAGWKAALLIVVSVGLIIWVSIRPTLQLWDAISGS